MEKLKSEQNLAELELFRDRVHFAMESALRQSLDPSISKKVTAKLVQRNSWREATRMALSQTLKGAEAPKRFASPVKAAYNWHRFIFYGQFSEDFEKLVRDCVKGFLGHEHFYTLNLGSLSGVALVDLLERIAPNLLENLIDNIRLCDDIRKRLRLVNFCDYCDAEISAFGRCMSTDCHHMHIPQKQEFRPLKPFKPFYVKVHTANACYKVDAAPGVEILILESNVFDVLKREAVDEEGILDPVFHPFVSRTFAITEPIKFVEIDRQVYIDWIEHEYKWARVYSVSTSPKPNYISVEHSAIKFPKPKI